MKNLSVQIPATFIMLTVLLGKLGFQPGILKAVETKGGEISIWYQGAFGEKAVRRVKATQASSYITVAGDSYRRCFDGLEVQLSDKSWVTITDEDYQRVNLEPPCEYGGWEIAE